MRTKTLLSILGTVMILMVMVMPESLLTEKEVKVKISDIAVKQNF